MARPFRFRGMLSSLDVDLAVASNRQLRGFVDRLAELPMRGGGRVGPDRARRAVVRLLIGALDQVAEEASGRFDANLARVQRLRADLHGRYQRVLALFAPAAPRVRALPDDLRPSSIARLFDELDRAIDDLEASTSRRGLDDAMGDVDRTRSLDDIAAAERRAAAEAGHTDPTLFGPTPLDPDAPTPTSPRFRGEHDRAALARYRERLRLLPPDQRVRAEVDLDGQLWAASALPPGSTVGPRRVPDYSEGNLAALERFRTLDPTFSGRGYELLITLPDGTRFQPDGIRYLDPQGRRYQFLESKEPYTWTRDSFYATPEGQARLSDMLRRDAAIAQQLRGHGCAGFRYDTGHPDLDRFFAEAIDAMRREGIPGADLLLPP